MLWAVSRWWSHLAEWLSSARSSQPAFLPASARRIAAAFALAFAWPALIGLVIPSGAADAALLLLLGGVYCCAISGRTLTGLLAVATSAFAYTYVFAPPVHELALSGAKDIANLGMFLTLASLVAGHVGIQQAQNERLHRQKRALRESESRKSAILNSALDCVVTIDHHGRIVEFNPAAEEAFGHERSDAIGAPMADLLIPPSLRDAHRAAFAHYLDTGEGSLLGSRIETTAMRADGGEFPIEIAVVQVDLPGPPVFTAYLRDISERREAEKAQKKAERELKRQAERSRQLALHDSLTGLSNRTLFRDRLEHGLQVTRRQSGQMAVLIMDLDRFKEINDTLGHQTGDLVLQELGARLGTTLRSSDTISRLGGDEFGVLLTGVSASEAVEAAKRIQRAVAEPIPVGELQLQIDASIGIALFPDHGDEADLLVQRADVAMYLAKESHSGFALYDPGRDDNEPSRLALLGELRQAFDRRELVLYYQPQVQLRTGEVAGVEALVRWQHPERGLLGPDEFIPLVERGGLVRRLTTYVLEEALAQACAWQREWHHLLIAVNVSMRNLLDSSFPDELAGLLERWGLDATQLALEITESSIVADPMRVRSVLERLHEMGLRLAVDDFGTGYASLAHLSRLPVDEIKIDRSFVSGMTMDGDDALIVRSTIDLGRNLGLEVVAEGVESHDVYRRLAELGCDAGQGFFFGRPMPADELIRWLDRRRQIALPQAYSAHKVAS